MSGFGRAGLNSKAKADRMLKVNLRKEIEDAQAGENLVVSHSCPQSLVDLPKYRYAPVLEMP